MQSVTVVLRDIRTVLLIFCLWKTYSGQSYLLIWNVPPVTAGHTLWNCPVWPYKSGTPQYKTAGKGGWNEDNCGLSYGKFLNEWVLLILCFRENGEYFMVHVWSLISNLNALNAIKCRWIHSVQGEGLWCTECTDLWIWSTSLIITCINSKVVFGGFL